MVRSGRLPEYRPPATTEGFEGYEQAINDSLLRLPEAGSILVGRANLGGSDDISREHFRLTWVNNPLGSVRMSDGGERPFK